MQAGSRAAVRAVLVQRQAGVQMGWSAGCEREAAGQAAVEGNASGGGGGNPGPAGGGCAGGGLTSATPPPLPAARRLPRLASFERETRHSGMSGHPDGSTVPADTDAILQAGAGPPLERMEDSMGPQEPHSSLQALIAHLNSCPDLCVQVWESGGPAPDRSQTPRCKMAASCLAAAMPTCRLQTQGLGHRPAAPPRHDGCRRRRLAPPRTASSDEGPGACCLRLRSGALGWVVPLVFYPLQQACNCMVGRHPPPPVPHARPAEQQRRRGTAQPAAAAHQAHHVSGAALSLPTGQCV